MLFLLPPSEAKTPGGSGPPLGRHPALSTPGLARPRRELMAALSAAARTDAPALAAGLQLPAGLAAAALAANRSVATAATMPALDRYAGVVYAALDVRSLSAVARARADAQVLVLSGLWGVVRGGDLVPDYRVPAGGRVPGVGRAIAHWREPLAAALPDLIGDEEVLDLRSTDYSAMWRPGPALCEQVVAVRVLAERSDGARRATVPVSYHAKAVKGLLVRHLVQGRRRHRDAMTALADAAAALDLQVHDARAVSVRSVRSVDLVGRYP